MNSYPFYTYIASNFLLFSSFTVISIATVNVDPAFPDPVTVLNRGGSGAGATITFSTSMTPGPVDGESTTRTQTTKHTSSSSSGLPQTPVGTTGGELLENATREEGEHLALFEGCDHIKVKELLATYGAASSTFVDCAVCHAKPVTFCGLCVDEYKMVLQAWHTINNDTICKNDILASDSLQIVIRTHQFLKKLWTDGDCQKCYETDSDCRPKNSTLHFMYLHNVTMECFHKYDEQADVPHADGNSSLCQNCSDEYNTLNRFFNCLPEGDLCIDIKDLMNRTRKRWTAGGCGSHGRALAVVIALSALIGTLPFFFYVAAVIHGTKKQQRLVDQIDPADTRPLTSSSSSRRLYAGTTDSLWS